MRKKSLASKGLNPDKSEVAMLCTSQRVKTLKNALSVTVAGAPINLLENIKSLGVTLVSSLSFDKHVNDICKACYFHIHGLRHVRRTMSKDTAQMIACSIIGFRLDYCNALLAGMSEQNLNKLQRVQNSQAPVVTGTHRRDHITPVLADLHWLPVRARITFKICMLVYKVRVTQQPTYMADLI